MVRNSDMLKKMMDFSRELREASRAHGEEGRHPFPTPFPPPMESAGRGAHRPGGHEAPPPFPPHDPEHFHPGPMGRGMSRERMLVVISEHPEGIRQKQLAEEAGINASSASEVVSRLEDDGYLVRTIDESDRRATVLKLTEMGAVRADEVREERDAFLEDFFGKLNKSEKQTLSDILDKLLEK